MSWNPAAAYNELPALPPVVELETPRVLKQCIRSRTALEKVHQCAEFLPNKELLIHIMPLLEARASSDGVQSQGCLRPIETRRGALPSVTTTGQPVRRGRIVRWGSC